MRHYPSTWSNPGGSVEPGEMPLQAAVRELEEETGIVVAPHELHYSHMSIEPPFHVRNYIVGLNRMVEPRLDTEHVAWKWVRTH
jgi:8-oxo-dGTP pyrophosphatase MutT (NUDIX family)